MEHEYDFLGIGDITIDAFIKIKEARVLRDHNGEKPQLCFNFADKVPYEDVYVIDGYFTHVECLCGR